MSHTFPCPNPVCTHVFPPDAVKGTAHLTCPQCGLSFDFRGSSSTVANAKPPAPPVAKPRGTKAVPISGSPVPPPRTAPAKPKTAAALPVLVAAPVVPVAMPVVAAPPVAAPVVPAPSPVEDDPFAAAFAALAPTDASPPPDDLQFDAGAASPATESRRRVPRKKKGGRPLLLILLAAVAVVFLLCIGIAGSIAWLTGVSFTSLSGFSGASWEWPQGNCSFKAPDTAWKQDKDLQLKWKLHHAMKRSQPDNYLALYFQDYKTRSPSEAELREGAVSRLKANLGESLETEFKSDKKLSGQPAKVLEFAGLDENNVLMAGECYMVSYQGYAYWFFTWGPESLSDQIKPEWEKARQGFALGNARSGWKETGRQTDIVRNSSGSKLRYQLKPVRGLWKVETNADTRALYEKADQVLLGLYPGEPKGTVKAATSATAQVIVLDEASLQSATLPDAIAAAKSFVLEREKSKGENGDYIYPNTKMDLVQDKTVRLIDDPYGNGMGVGQVQKYVVVNDPGRERYVVLRIVNHPQGVVVLWLECDNRYRDYWDSEFMVLLESLEFK